MAKLKYSFDESKVLAIRNADKAKAQEIGEELALISSKAGGHLTPPAVVDAARDKKNPLHPYFEWDDVEAAKSWRIEQARELIASIHVENSDSETGLARAFLSIREKDGTSYRALSEVLQSADLQSRVLAAAERDLLSFEARYRNLSDICDLIRDVREQIAIRRSKQESRQTA